MNRKFTCRDQHGSERGEGTHWTDVRFENAESALVLGPVATACDQRGWRSHPEAWAMPMPLSDSARLVLR